MGTIAYPYLVRDSANTTSDNRKTGLTPTVSDGKTLAASPATVLASTVAVVPIGAGVYVALYDPTANGDAAFPVDWGSTLTNPNDRYGALVLTRPPATVVAVAPALSYDGTAQGGSSTTIVLASTASAVDNACKNFMVRTVGGTGPNQGPFRITGYVGSTKVATVSGTFSPTPDATTQYVLDPPVAADIYQWVEAAPLPLSSGLVQATATLSLGTDAISGAAMSAGAVTKIQAGLATPTNITAGTITTVTNLTNAATAGDFNAAQKASLNAATPAAASVAAPVTIADGSITSAKFSTGTVNASATGFLERLLLLVQRSFPVAGGSVTAPKSGNGSIVVKGAGGATVSSQSAADDGTTQTLGAAS